MKFQRPLANLPLGVLLPEAVDELLNHRSIILLLLAEEHTVIKDHVCAGDPPWAVGGLQL